MTVAAVVVVASIALASSQFVARKNSSHRKHCLCEEIGGGYDSDFQTKPFFRRIFFFSSFFFKWKNMKPQKPDFRNAHVFYLTEVFLRPIIHHYK